MLSTVDGAVVQFFVWVWANWALGLVQINRSVLCGSSLIRMCSLLGFAHGQSFWIYYLGPAGMNLVCQDLCAGCYRPSSISITVRFPLIEP